MDEHDAAAKPAASKAEEKTAKETGTRATPVSDSVAGEIVAGEIVVGETVDQEEIAFFARLADSWWDPDGPFKPLHRLNPTRLRFIRDHLEAHFALPRGQARPFEGLRLLDIGCGGGLVSEPMARLGASVMGVDASANNIGTASIHAARMGLAIDYRHTTSQALAETGALFDVIINMEVVEHVADVGLYLSSCRQLLAANGVMICSTLNRTVKSFVFAIVGAEYILRWLPRGAHDWRKFITPDELSHVLGAAGFAESSRSGFVFSPFGGWSVSPRDLSVNYAMVATAA